MHKKQIIEAVVGVLVIVVIAVGVFAVMHQKQSVNPQAAATPDPNLVAPSGSVTDISASSISVQQQDTTQKTFAIGSTTEVISQVSSGQVGKGLSDIAVGDMVIIRPSASDPATAASIELFAALGVANGVPSSAASAPSSPPVSLLGSVVSVSPSMLVVKPQDPAAANVQVVVTKSTVVRSNVLAGQKGKTFKDIVVGSPVFVAGTTGSSSIIANSIQLLVPINQQTQ